MNISPENVILIAAIISLDIAEGKSLEEIHTYRNLFNAIANNLQAYCNHAGYIDKRKK